jgi:hypothetical protein
LDVQTSIFQWAKALLFPPDVPAGLAGDRSGYERFALPFTFKPRLSLPEAVVAVFGALARIVLGSLLFAVWGSYTYFFWSAIHNSFWRLAVILPLFAAFLVSLTVLLVAISAAVRAITTRLPVPK